MIWIWTLNSSALIFLLYGNGNAFDSWNGRMLTLFIGQIKSMLSAFLCGFYYVKKHQTASGFFVGRHEDMKKCRQNQSWVSMVFLAKFSLIFNWIVFGALFIFCVVRQFPNKKNVRCAPKKKWFSAKLFSNLWNYVNGSWLGTNKRSDNWNNAISVRTNADTIY